VNDRLTGGLCEGKMWDYKRIQKSKRGEVERKRVKTRGELKTIQPEGETVNNQRGFSGGIAIELACSHVKVGLWTL